jgi:hypothetical protein
LLIFCFRIIENVLLEVETRLSIRRFCELNKYIIYLYCQKPFEFYSNKRQERERIIKKRGVLNFSGKLHEKG